MDEKPPSRKLEIPEVPELRFLWCNRNCQSVLLGDIVSRAFTPVLAKHPEELFGREFTGNGVDRIQRNFDC